MEQWYMRCLVQVTDPCDVAAVRELFCEYASQVDVPACFPGFANELAALPGAYAFLWLARCDGRPAGCVGLRQLDAELAEMKRLYVRPAHRGCGLGRALAEAAIAAARRSGHRRVVLDTLPAMHEAMVLYRALGFKDVAPYLEQPTPGARCLGLSL